jgi:hypothetical protein
MYVKSINIFEIPLNIEIIILQIYNYITIVRIIRKHFHLSVVIFMFT